MAFIGSLVLFSLKTFFNSNNKKSSIDKYIGYFWVFKISYGCVYSLQWANKQPV